MLLQSVENDNNLIHVCTCIVQMFQFSQKLHMSVTIVSFEWTRIVFAHIHIFFWWMIEWWCHFSKIFPVWYVPNDPVHWHLCVLFTEPKRTRRFLSAIINFWRFSVEREDVYYNICQEIVSWYTWEIWMCGFIGKCVNSIQAPWQGFV